ncbi:MAG TPA: hypothetical protein VHE35_29480 [Kofleriaceae bacterium]|nr:hypothetical protein [Kofleriaceae bacterium]
MRLAKHLPILLLASTLPLAALAAACGGDDSSGDGDGTVDPDGTNHTYAISKVSVPSNGTEATQLGLDIDEKPNDANGGIDNQLGMVLGNIGALAPDLHIQTSIDEQVDQGGIILLANVVAKDLTNASGVGLAVYQGENPRPAPCTDANDTVCRHHLDGTGMFDVAADSRPAQLAGKIVAGKFSGGPGTVTLSIALSAGMPIDLPLQKAKAELSGISATGITSGKIGGAIAKADLETKVYPAIAATIRATYDRDCPMTPERTIANGCNCAAGTTGKTLQTTFDKTPPDCMISDSEVVGFVSGLVSPDIDLDGDGMADAVSLGVGVQAVAGAFTPPTN